jgi:CheY-like chemotaxis protein
VSRITRGKLELRRERLALESALQAAVETSRPLIEAARHDLAFDLPTVPVYVLGDLTRLAQIFSNLLNNAAKYTPPGGRITLSARVVDGMAVIEVRDTGMGISAEALPNIFEMFAQANRERGLTHGGLGIGLALVHGLTEMHGGTVGAASDGVGSGSSFTVRLPALAVTDEEAASVPTQAAPAVVVRRRVLVADDNLDAAESLAMLLTMMGHEVRAAHDGLQAVEQAEQFHPDLILMDVGMPRLDGLQAATQIRATPWGASPVIVALTGLGSGSRPQTLQGSRLQRALCEAARYRAAVHPSLAAARSERARLETIRRCHLQPASPGRGSIAHPTTAAGGKRNRAAPAGLSQTADL